MRFLSVKVSRCSSGAHIVWDVVYADGTQGRIHAGLWPNLSEAQRLQLTESRKRFQLAEWEDGVYP